MTCDLNNRVRSTTIPKYLICCFSSRACPSSNSAGFHLYLCLLVNSTASVLFTASERPSILIFPDTRLRASLAFCSSSSMVTPDTMTIGEAQQLGAARKLQAEYPVICNIPQQGSNHRPCGTSHFTCTSTLLFPACVSAVLPWK